MSTTLIIAIANGVLMHLAIQHIVQILALSLFYSCCCAQAQPASAALLGNVQNMKTVAAGSLESTDDPMTVAIRDSGIVDRQVERKK